MVCSVIECWSVGLVVYAILLARFDFMCAIGRVGFVYRFWQSRDLY